MTAEELWKIFSEKTDITAEYDAWAFGTDADVLAELVRNGIKTATSSAYPLYAADNEPLPKVGEYSVILNSADEAVCIIKSTRVYTVPFNDVDASHAFKEGEGDRSLLYWQKIHREFFTECMSEAGLTFNGDMPVVCEEFEVVHPRLAVQMAKKA